MLNRFYLTKMLEKMLALYANIKVACATDELA